MANALEKWLALTWERPERSYNPDLRDFLAGLLGYPKKNVVTEDNAPSGYADLLLLSPEGKAWVVGDLKKDDNVLTDSVKRQKLWEEKQKYVSGLTRYVLFVTPSFLLLLFPDGSSIPGLESPLDLTKHTFEEIREKLSAISNEKASHDKQWLEFVRGDFPYSYLTLNQEDSLKRLRADLRDGFAEITSSAEKAMLVLQKRYESYTKRMKDVDDSIMRPESKRRAVIRLELDYSLERALFDEALPQFNEQYGREINKDQEKRIYEAFIADSVAALIARILFLRLVEDLGLSKKRMLSNGGPKRWSEFVEQLTGDARTLIHIASEDVRRIYQEPFNKTVFDWINATNGELDEVLQRFILRFNAYDFSGLSEEILGDIYQQFLPVAKRKRLGEFYTPPSIIDWILENTVKKEGLGKLLDPSCGSGSFLVRYTNWRLEDAKNRLLDKHEVRKEVQDEVWGFDLNPFASFISYFQMMWALLRYLPSEEPPDIHITTSTPSCAIVTLPLWWVKNTCPQARKNGTAQSGSMSLAIRLIFGQSASSMAGK
jgi:N-6 DNA Methylase